MPQLLLTPANQSEVDQLKELFDKGRDVDLFLCTNPHLIAALLLEYALALARLVSCFAAQMVFLAMARWGITKISTGVAGAPSVRRQISELREGARVATGAARAGVGCPVGQPTRRTRADAPISVSAHKPDGASRDRQRKRL